MATMNYTTTPRDDATLAAYTAAYGGTDEANFVQIVQSHLRAIYENVEKARITALASQIEQLSVEQQAELQLLLDGALKAELEA